VYISPDRYQPSTVQLAIDKVNTLNNWQLTTDQVDKLVDTVADIASPEYRGWYCRRLMTIGPDEFLSRAAKARSGNTPGRLFSALLKRR
jgi:hypothetical protein